MLDLPKPGEFYHCAHCRRTLKATVGPQWIAVEFCHDDGGTQLVRSWACPQCLRQLQERGDEDAGAK